MRFSIFNDRHIAYITTYDCRTTETKSIIVWGNLSLAFRLIFMASYGGLI